MVLVTLNGTNDGQPNGFFNDSNNYSDYNNENFKWSWYLTD